MMFSSSMADIACKPNTLLHKRELGRICAVRFPNLSTTFPYHVLLAVPMVTPREFRRRHERENPSHSTAYVSPYTPGIPGAFSTVKVPLSLQRDRLNVATSRPFLHRVRSHKWPQTRTCCPQVYLAILMEPNQHDIGNIYMQLHLYL